MEASNPENLPGLVRRDKPDPNTGAPGKILERISWQDADRAYGCASWQDWNEILDRAQEFLKEVETRGL